MLIQSWPLNPENNNLNENGLVIGDFTGGFKAADGFANLKSNNYLMYVMAAMFAKQQHWNDALILNHLGTYADATIANLWMIKDGKIFTPTLADGPVAGTMRQFLLDNLEEAGYSVVEKSITKKELAAADEVFLSNAIYGIKWVKQHENAVYVCNIAASIHASLIAPCWSATI
jgi:branched-chain amino acid aminotransferase